MNVLCRATAHSCEYTQQYVLADTSFHDTRLTGLSIFVSEGDFAFRDCGLLATGDREGDFAFREGDFALRPEQIWNSWSIACHMLKWTTAMDFQ